jgi:outer membrane biogenesis lipoprotein LolB
MRPPGIAVLATVVLLAGCASRSAPRPIPAPAGTLPAADAIFAALAQRREAVRGLRALARLSYSSPDESRKAKQLLVAERPDRLRLEILSPFGAVFVLTTADGALAAWARDESTVYRGVASRQNLERYANVDLPVGTVVDLLLGTPPLQPDADTVVSNDAGLTEVWQDLSDTVQVGWFNDHLEPVRYEQREQSGEVRLRTAFDGYATIDGMSVPTQISIELPVEQRRVDLALSETEVNPALPDSVFALETPSGSRVVDLDQGIP